MNDRDIIGDLMNTAVGVMYFLSWFFLIASVVGFAATMNMWYAAAIIPFALIVFAGMFK